MKESQLKMKRSESVGVTLVAEKVWWEKSDEKVTLRVKNQNSMMTKTSLNTYNESPQRDMTPQPKQFLKRK